MDDALPSIALFKKTYHHTPARVARAPGHIEILGDHAEPCRGLALTMALRQGVSVALSPREDGRIELVSDVHGSMEGVSLGRLGADGEWPAWSRLPRAFLETLQRHGLGFTGLSLAVGSDLTQGVGLGSSSALMVALAQVLREHKPYRLRTSGIVIPHLDRRRRVVPSWQQEERDFLVTLGAQVERKVFGESVVTPERGMQTSAKARRWHALRLDFLHEAAVPVPLVGEVGWVVTPYAVPSHGIWPVRRMETAHQVAQLMGARSMRSVDLDWLKKHRRRLSQRQFDWARHVVGECHRVPYAEQALHEGDFAQLGLYLTHSHESAREGWGGLPAEAELLFSIARSHRACLGARFSFSRRGGVLVSLVKLQAAEAFMEKLDLLFSSVARREVRSFFSLSCGGME